MIKNSEKGVSLIEALVCMVIVGVGFVAMLQVGALTISSMDRAVEKNKVNFLTEMMMEDIVSDPDSIAEYAKFNERCGYNQTSGSNNFDKKKNKWKDKMKRDDDIKIGSNYKKPPCDNNDIKRVLSASNGEQARIRFLTNKGKSKKYIGLVLK